MRFEFDGEADALYVGIEEGRVERTIELDEGVYADLDAEGGPSTGPRKEHPGVGA